jgi:hypothetical protein
VTQPARRVDPWRQPEADRARVDRGRIDVGRFHQSPQAGLRGAREAPEAGDDQGAVLVHEGDDVGDGGQGDEIELPLELLDTERLEELVDDPGSTELGERVIRGLRGHNRAIGQPVPWAVVVGDDDVESQGPCLRNLLDRGNPAVHREHEAALLSRETRQRLAG